MFDAYARSLLNDVPEFDGLTGDSVARALSRAYLAILQYRTNAPEAVEDIADTHSFLRRVANALLYHIVLDEERDTPSRQAGAFVVAEAVALLADHIAATVENRELQNERVPTERSTRLEAALLYLFADYNACAAGVLTLSGLAYSPSDPVHEQARAWCHERLESLCRMHVTAEAGTGPPIAFEDAAELSATRLEQDTVGRLYAELGLAAVEFSNWLAGNQNGRDAALARLDRLLAALSPGADTENGTRTGNDYARVHHLATLLRLCLPALGNRSLVHTVPAPPGSNRDAYVRYLRLRAVGSARNPGRPLLWPSAAAYVQKCILGDLEHAVVSMPTGSGKSFVAELAISQALSTGWVLCLAPTNALTEQIRGDLRDGLAELDTDVLAFIGDQEYSVLRTETVTQIPPNTVAVMTPEKCALALRLTPEAFESCSLVVFDECHLIGDTGSSRGPVAELVLSQLMLRAPRSRFLLMSAIIQNPEELADWLAAASGGRSGSVSIRWRPTRTLRSVLGVEDVAFQREAKAAKEELASLPDRRKKLAFTSTCALAACLQGAWQSTNETDYSTVAIECDAQLSVRRKRGADNWKYEFNADSWVNATAINLATVLAETGIQTLVFTPASRHYPFSNGSKVTLASSALNTTSKYPELIRVCRILADYELGISSAVFKLLDRGVAVHSSLMLEVEKIASELAFKKRCVPIMFATGTLAQGLNLPAIAVVIAGTRIGDPRGEDADVVKQRKFSQLLNAAGRAGRAGFANQGVVITIPDKPLLLRKFAEVLHARDQADFLQQADDAVSIGSGLDIFLDNVCQEVLGTDQANDLELQVVASLTGGDENQLDPQRVLQRTYAAFRRTQAGQAQVTSQNVERLLSVRDEFIANTKAPEWLTVAAQRAGLDFFVTLGISMAWGRSRKEIPEDYRTWDVTQWLEEMLGAAPQIAPGLLANLLPSDRLARASEEFKQLSKTQPDLFFERGSGWRPPIEWESAWNTLRLPLRMWMSGDSTARVASIVAGTPEVAIPSDRTQGKPIPRALSVVGETWSSLSLIAGGFLAVAEQLLGQSAPLPLPLACLPMCIKYGCDSPGTLAWFRFGVRLRRASRLLATAFPPPETIQTDEDLRQWVRTQRREWLSGNIDLGERVADNELAICEAVKAFVTG